MQKISSKIEESEARWPTRVYLGKEEQMKFSYTRRAEPNFKIKSARTDVKAIVHTSVLQGWRLKK